YGLRRQMLEGVDQKDLILEDYVSGMLGDLLHRYMPEDKHVDEWDYESLKRDILGRFQVDIGSEKELSTLNRQELGDKVFDMLRARYEEKEKMLGADAMRYHERMLMLSVLDQLWKEHLLNMDHLKEGIGLRGYGQKDPLVEYKRESFAMFEEMMQRFQEDTVRYLYLMQILERPVGCTPAPGSDGAGGGSDDAPLTLRTGNGNAAQRPPRAVSTSVDEIEEAFQRRKRRELEQAKMAGAGETQTVQQVV